MRLPTKALRTGGELRLSRVSFIAIFVSSERVYLANSELVFSSPPSRFFRTKSSYAELYLQERTQVTQLG